MNIKEIKEMINLMNENNLMELEIEKDGMRVKLKKTNAEAPQYTGPVVIERSRSAQTQPAEIPHQAPVEKAETKTIEIKAPMVGTFYRAPAPEAPPYVEVGQTIEAGQVVCIIEAMKLMNEIKAEVRGKIVEILVENAEPVEFSQTMFILEPL